MRCKGGRGSTVEKRESKQGRRTPYSGCDDEENDAESSHLLRMGDIRSLETLPYWGDFITSASGCGTSGTDGWPQPISISQILCTLFVDELDFVRIIASYVLRSDCGVDRFENRKLNRGALHYSHRMSARVTGLAGALILRKRCDNSSEKPPYCWQVNTYDCTEALDNGPVRRGDVIV